MKCLLFFYLWFLIFDANFAGPCDDINIITRDKWGNRVYRRRAKPVLSAKRVFIHHANHKLCTETEDCVRRARELEERHIKIYRFLDIGYHFMIGGDGKVYEGRGWKRLGGHTKNFNYDIGILFLGNFEDERPPQNMLDTTLKLMECGREWGLLLPGYSVYGHRDVGCTVCPGRKLYWAIQKWDQYAREKSLTINCYGSYEIF